MNHPTNPTEPATGHRADPRYVAARDAFTADMVEGEHEDDAYARHVTAAFQMWQVAKEYNTPAATAAQVSS